MTLDQWLDSATHGLSPESAARVRTEIQQHCEAARDAGDAAVDALGDPQAANRQYRKVLLTETEALLAPTLTKPTPVRAFNGAIYIVALALFVKWLSGKGSGAGFAPITVAIYSTMPLSWFFPLNTPERTRLYLWIHAVRNVAVVALAWWYQGWIGAGLLGALCFALDYFVPYQRLQLFRKLDAGQTYAPLAEEPELTHIEAIWLNTLRKPSGPAENLTAIVVTVGLAAMGVWLPGPFAPMAVAMVFGFLARHVLGVNTEAGSHRLRVVRWTVMAIAALLPPLYGARSPWIGAVMLAMFFYLFDYRGIALRRKLPVDQWPARLYW